MNATPLTLPILPILPVLPILPILPILPLFDSRWRRALGWVCRCVLRSRTALECHSADAAMPCS